jgi:hypothetical protein
MLIQRNQSDTHCKGQQGRKQGRKQEKDEIFGDPLFQNRRLMFLEYYGMLSDFLDSIFRVVAALDDTRVADGQQHMLVSGWVASQGFQRLVCCLLTRFSPEWFHRSKARSSATL